MITNERESHEFLRTTAVSRATARAMTWTFVAMLVAVTSIDLTRNAGLWRSFLTSGRSLLAREFLHEFERALQDHSPAKAAVQPRVQTLLLRAFAYGNHRVLAGKDDWLFYMPGVEWLVNQEKPAARNAIIAFGRECRARGVRLIVVPAPEKAALEWRHLRFAHAIDQRLDYDDLRAAGIEVVDGRSLDRHFLAHDTHWTPQSMDTFARALANAIGLRGDTTYTTRRMQVSSEGDLVTMLGVHLPAERTEIEQVVDWKPDRSSPILLLGDSFTNVYSDGVAPRGLGWGERAGLAEHLSLALGMPLDVIARNGSGANETRAELARRDDPFGGKRVIVYEFAARDLSAEDWRVIPFHPPRVPHLAESSNAVRIEGTIVKTSTMPQPFHSPYADCVAFYEIHVDRVLAGRYDDPAMLVAIRVMTGNVLLPPAAFRAGQHVRLDAIPFREASAEIASIQQSDDTGDYAHKPYFALRADPQ